MEIVCIVRGENCGSKSYRDLDGDYRAHIQFWEFCFLVTFVTHYQFKYWVVKMSRAVGNVKV